MADHFSPLVQPTSSTLMGHFNINILFFKPKTINQPRPKFWSVPSRLIFSRIDVSKSRIDILEQKNQSVVADSSSVTLKKTVRCLPFVQTRTVQVSPTSSAYSCWRNGNTTWPWSSESSPCPWGSGAGTDRRGNSPLSGWRMLTRGRPKDGAQDRVGWQRYRQIFTG